MIDHEANEEVLGNEETQNDQSVQEEQVASLQNEVTDLKDKLLRSMAEVENIQKRSQRDLQSSLKYAAQAFAKDLLEVSDNLERTLESLPEDITDETLISFKEGVEMIHSSLQKAFEKHHIQKIDPKGQIFDHNFHQAVSEVPNDKVAPGTVIELCQAGYMLHDRLLRPAMVIVAKS